MGALLAAGTDDGKVRLGSAQGRCSGRRSPMRTTTTVRCRAAPAPALISRAQTLFLCVPRVPTILAEIRGAVWCQRHSFLFTSLPSSSISAVCLNFVHVGGIPLFNFFATPAVRLRHSKTSFQLAPPPSVRKSVSRVEKCVLCAALSCSRRSDPHTRCRRLPDSSGCRREEKSRSRGRGTIPAQCAGSRLRILTAGAGLSSR